MTIEPGISLDRYQNDFTGFCALLDIVPKGEPRRKFILNQIQREYCAARTPRDVILKPRQVGITTLELARDIWFFLTRPGAKVVVVCQSMTTHEALKTVCEVLRIMFEGLAAEGVKLDFRTESTTEWTLEDASLRVIEAGASEASAQKKGRGGTITRLHLTETAFWEYAEDTLDALLECVPGPERGSEIVSECTPNGASGVYYEQYRAASTGTSGYKAHFFPWWKQAEYAIALAPGETIVAETRAEKALVARKPDLTPEQLKWYRAKVAEKGRADIVAQEYPVDEETAFLLRGDTFFDREVTVDLLGKTSDPIAIEMGGALRLWRRPEAERVYVISADPSEGTGNDACAARVWDRETGEDIGTLLGQWKPWTFAQKLARVGYMFNDAAIVVERNNHGHAVLQALEHLRDDNDEPSPYPNIYQGPDEKPGWVSGETRRSAALDALEHAHRTGAWAPKDRAVVGELFVFVVDKKTGKAQAASGAKDDLVLASAIGWDVIRRPMAHAILPSVSVPSYRLTGGRGY